MKTLSTLGILTGASVSGSMKHPVYVDILFQLIYLFGAAVGCACCEWLWFTQVRYQVYGMSVMMGVAQAALLVASLSLTADLIGKNTVTSVMLPAHRQSRTFLHHLSKRV